MPSIINASSSGSGGIVQTADASGVLQLQSNGTVAVTISGANVSFGSSSSPSGWSAYQAIELINGGSNGALAKWGSGVNTAIVTNAYYSSAWTYYSTNTVALYQQETGATHNFYSAPSGTAGTGVSLTQVMTFAKDTSVALQGASRQAGTGITFPATQSASSDANTLDDYEEGTWTPTFSTTGTNYSTLTYSVQLGHYTKVGNMVTFWGWLETATVAGGSGSVQIGGLPFTTAFQATLSNNWSNGAWSTQVPISGHVLSNSTSVYLTYFAATQTVQLPSANLINGSQIIFSGVYRVG